MTLTEDQKQAVEKINDFLKDQGSAEAVPPREAPTAFLLEGGAGVGKTFLLGQILSSLDRYTIRCVAAPTHKAINVLRRKLDGFGVEWCQGFDDYTYNGTDVITGTTAQLLGIRPIITDDQSTELKFGRAGKGILSKIKPPVVIVDEVSMLGWKDFKDLRLTLKGAGCKLIAVGDAGQLPPVKQEAIPFEKFLHRAPLREIVRQAAGSNIIQLAWAIRDGRPWTQIEGAGVRRTSDLRAAFLEAVTPPGVRPEEEREVYIAYTNRVVNEVQERACQKMYKHSRLAFEKGELVLAETNLYRGKVMMCCNQDELIVDSFEEQLADDIGVPVVLHHRSRPGRFTAVYIAPEDMKNPAHPYNLELKTREKKAQDFQERWKTMPRGYTKEETNKQRRQAWASFFEWRDQTIIAFRHPFAITSHKSQGSTYRQVFADAADLGRFNSQALYVAVTRPSEELILSRV